MRSIETIAHILTSPVWLLYLGFSAGIIAYFNHRADEREDDNSDPASHRKDSK